MMSELFSSLLSVGTFALLVSSGPLPADFSGAANEASVRAARGAHVSMQLPVEMFTTLLEGDSGADTLPEAHARKLDQTHLAIIELSLSKRRPVGGTRSDVGWVCHGSLSTCAASGDTQNYWLDKTVNELRIGDPTEPVLKAQFGPWNAYEAFPLCGWTSPRGVSSPYGGQCTRWS
jgi:hypothetical protein